MGISEKQFVALAIVPKITASISIPCQLWIIKEVIIDHREGRGKATSRALLAMGCIDIMASFGWFLSTWAAPSGTEGVPFASGGTRSCTFQGFLLQLAIGAPMYNCLLSLFYLLMICFGWSESRLNRLERGLHLTIIVFASGTGIALIPLGMYNHVSAVCWVMGLPQGCGNSNYNPGSEPCERGDYAWLVGLSLFYIPLWVCILFTTTAMSMVYRKVRRREARNQRYMGSGRIRSNEVFFQALLYTLAFYVTWLPSTLWSITQWFDSPMFWLDLLATICEPSQGLLNMLVFIRPRKDLQQQLKRDLLKIVTCGLCGREKDVPPVEPSESHTRSREESAVSASGTEGESMNTSGGRLRISLMNRPNSYREGERENSSNTSINHHRVSRVCFDEDNHGGLGRIEESERGQDRRGNENISSRHVHRLSLMNQSDSDKEENGSELLNTEEGERGRDRRCSTKSSSRHLRKLFLMNKAESNAEDQIGDVKESVDPGATEEDGIGANEEPTKEKEKTKGSRNDVK